MVLRRFLFHAARKAATHPAVRAKATEVYERDVKPLAKALGLPMAPITPTFPWFGPLGMLPYPVRYKIIYGEPIDYSDRFGPEAADDSRIVAYLAKQVRRSVQQLVDTHR
jgi:hypothetical protein